MMQKNVFLGLGSNLGDRHATLRSAVEQLGLIEGVEVVSQSEIIVTKPIGGVVQGDYLNMVVKVVTSVEPRILLDMCLDIEEQHGRTREKKWAARTLDIDILFYGAAIIDEEGLKIPHPEVHLRRFALEPMEEIAPTFEHPVFKQPVWAMLQLL